MGVVLGAASVCPCVGRAQGEENNSQFSGHVDKRARREQQREQQRIRGRERRREQRQRSYWTKKLARKEFLASMGEEERASFLEAEKKEREQKSEQTDAALQRAYVSGAPKVVVNCSFASTMDNKELSSLAKQLQLSYTLLRDLASPIQLHFTSLKPDDAGFHALDRRGYRKWLVHVHADSVWDLFEHDHLVFLSPDADEDLDEVREDRVYVIGGIVDRQIRRNESRAHAEAHGAVCLRRLPVKTFGPPGMYPVLNIDVVVAILHERLKRGRDSSWHQILLDCMPQRQHPGPTRGMLRKQRREARACESVAGEAACTEQTLDESSGTESPSMDGHARLSSNAGCDAKPETCEILRQGTQVEVAGYGRATVISLGVLPHGINKGKYHVRYWDGKTYHILPEQIASVIAN